MKIAVIGGASVRTPLLVKGLAHSEFPIEEIALFDTDQARLAIIATLAGRYAACVRAYGNPRDAIAGADFVFLSIRAGGISARAHDEAAAIALGVVGQETVGPAGFAMAMRNIPTAVEYARLIRDVAPSAWIINFTNPVSIVTQAITAAGPARVIGICDTPTELFERVAHTLDVPSDRCRFDYFGLNHLGWLREVYVDGAPQLPRLWNNPALLANVYRSPLFEPEFLSELRLLPTEYLFYYYRPRLALENMRSAGRTRGHDIAELNQQLFHDLAAAGSAASHVYERYLDERSAGYMQAEADTKRENDSRPLFGGYDRIALEVVRAIHLDTDAVIPLNVLNAGSLGELADTDVVEVPCAVSAAGAQPLAVEPMPGSARDLVVRVKEYERLTIAAATTPSMETAVLALAHNPLVDSTGLAQRLIAAMRPFDFAQGRSC